MTNNPKVDEVALLGSLQAFECPFNWNFPDNILSLESCVKKKMVQLEKKISVEEDKTLFPTEFAWRKYIYHIAISYYYSKVEKKDQAFETIDKVCALMEVSEDSFFRSYKSSFFHVVLAMKARFYFEKQDYVKAKEIADKVKLLSAMSNQEKAAVLGIKVSVFNEFGSDCSLLVLDDIREAVKLNPDEVEWSFILGKVLRRIQKVAAFFEIPEKEEITALENAYNKKKCSTYCVFLALAYKELSTKLFQKFGLEKFGEKIRVLNQNSLKLLREALTYDDLTAQTVSKISRGLADLPFPFKDVKKAKELALKAVEMDSAHPITLHTLAMHYERHDLNFEKALEFNAKALQQGSYGSGMDIIKINLKLDPSYDPLPILTQLKVEYTGEGHMNETTVQEACYYLMVKKDLDRALEIFVKIMEKTPDLHQLKVCKPLWIQVKTPISIFEVLYHELKSSRNKSRSTSYMDVLMMIKQLHPELFEKEVDEHFLDNLKTKSEEILKKYAQKRPTDYNKLYQSAHNNGHYRDRDTRSDNWRNNRQTDGRNSFGDGRYDNSRNYNQNRNSNNYRCNDNRFNNRWSTDNHQDEEIPFENRMQRNKEQIPFENRMQRNKEQIPFENRMHGSKEEILFVNRMQGIKSQCGRTRNVLNNRNKSVHESNPSVAKYTNKKGENEYAPTKAFDKSGQSEIVKKEVAGEKINSKPREKSFEKKHVGDKVVVATEKRSKATDMHATSSNEYKTNDSEMNSENTATIGGDKENLAELPNHKENKARGDPVETEDSIYNESEVCSDEEEYRKKMNSKLDRKKFLERMNQLSDKIKQGTRSEQMTNQMASVVKQNILEQEAFKSTDLTVKATSDNESNVVDTSPVASDHADIVKVTSKNKTSITDQIANLEIAEKMTETSNETITTHDTVEGKLSDEKIPSQPSKSESEPSSLLAEPSKELSEEEIKILLKLVQKSEKKKKKAKKATKNETDELSLVPPPKISVLTAANQPIRQPKGPSENNFEVRKKS